MKFYIGLLIFISIILLCLLIWKKNHLKWEKNREIKKRGKLGEKIISKNLSHLKGKLLNNYMILDKYKKSHQIDHVLISKHGVFIVETKNYSGSIYGNEDDKYWTQVLGNGNIKNQLYNPLKQNKIHYYQIKNLIIDKNIPIFSCVVFVDCDLKNVNANNVFNIEGLINFINKQPKILTNLQVKKIYRLLKSKKAKEISERKHLSTIKKTQRDIKNKICPRCSGKLTIKNDKNGKFYRCSNYPKCKFTKQIDDFDK